MIWTILSHWRAQRITQRSRHSKALRELPPGLYDYWKSSASHEFPGIPMDAVFFARAAEGLLDFFACAGQGGPCALPSKAADSVWHAWQRFSPLKLESFCRRHFGLPIPHRERGEMPGSMDDALATCLVRARRLEGIRPQGPRLPSLFLLDKKLRMPLGYGYAVQGGQPGYRQLDRNGKPDAPLHCPAQLAAAGLFSAGLITTSEFNDWEERARRESTSGSGCGSGCGSSLDGSSGDGGDGGGSSCGSGCGGGD